jgi:DNA-binding IclR family transcriptional regulator
MNSFEKAFNILEYIFNKNGIPSSPTEIAEAIEINRATCSRIISMLSKEGYIDQISRREGYVPGPALFSLSLRQSPYLKIANAATEPLRILAMKTDTIVNISAMKNGFRYILSCQASRADQHIPLSTRYVKDNYTCATGRLLLSASSNEEIDHVIKALGFPNEKWDGISDMPSMRKALDALRKRKTIKYPMYNVWIVGGLVEASGYMPAAIGLGVKTEADADKAVELVKIAAEEIKGNLSEDSNKVIRVY